MFWAIGGRVGAYIFPSVDPWSPHPCYTQKKNRLVNRSADHQKLSVNRRGQSSETFSTLVFFFNWRKFFLYFLTSNACCAEYQNIESNVRTRLSYNCAHLRWTKETLTIEYFRIILKKIWVKIFLVEHFWGENFFGLKIFLG